MGWTSPACRIGLARHYGSSDCIGAHRAGWATVKAAKTHCLTYRPTPALAKTGSPNRDMPCSVRLPGMHSGPRYHDASRRELRGVVAIAPRLGVWRLVVE